MGFATIPLHLKAVQFLLLVLDNNFVTQIQHPIQMEILYTMNL